MAKYVGDLITRAWIEAHAETDPTWADVLVRIGGASAAVRTADGVIHPLFDDDELIEPREEV